MNGKGKAMELRKTEARHKSTKTKEPIFTPSQIFNRSSET